MILSIIILVFSFLVLYYSSEKIFHSLIIMANYLNWREFVVSFLLMAFAASLPNLMLGTIAAFKNLSFLSFGDIIGNNIIILTLGIGISTLFSKKGIPIQSRTIKTTSLFTVFSSLLILILMLDKKLSRLDAFLLLLFFIFYLFWLFSKKERFLLNIQNSNDQNTISKLNLEKVALIEKEIKIFLEFLKQFFNILFFGLLLAFSSYGIVYASREIGYFLGFSLFIIGVLITGIGNSLPEISVALVSAKKGQDWMILGNLLGSVFMLNTLVLPIVLFISPIVFENNLFLSAFLSRFLFSLLVFIFYILSRTGEILSKKEGLILALLYTLFLFLVILRIL